VPRANLHGQSFVGTSPRPPQQKQEGPPIPAGFQIFT
jgi:hypothetical protein